ncbi:MAG: glycosyltransferase family 4 protein [Actinobacteria bacterium]|nr:glycosyltransferase family 4 protein [Actinomycetota bacterium]
MPRILLAYSRPARFVQLDRDILRERFAVEEWEQPGRLANPLRLVPAVRRADLVFGWFASWHTFLPVTLAWLLGKPSLLVVGGFDVAALPEIGYGYQQGGPQRWLSRWVMARATLLVVNSEFSRREVEANVGLRGKQVRVVYHGVPDELGELDGGEREPGALTVSAVARLSLERKGLRPFVETGALLPEMPFVLVGEWQDDAIEELRRRAAPNVSFRGWLSREALDDELRRAAVYVQASRHEGFGLAVAEAMLAGCIPVVTAVGALPEVVGEAGVRIEGAEPEQIAAGIRRALELGEGARRQARERILRHFPLERRRDALLELVDALLARA